MQFRLQTIISFILFGFFTNTARSENQFKIDRFHLQASLDEQTLMLVSEKTEAADVLALPAHQWKPVFKDFRFTSAQPWTWLKTTVRNELQVPIRVTIMLKTSLYSSVHFFVLDQASLIEQSHYSGSSTSLLHPFGDLRPIHTLTLEPGAERLVVVSIQNDAPHDFTWEIRDDETHQLESFQHAIRWTFLLATLVLIGLMALVQGILQSRSIPLALGLLMGFSLLYLLRLTHWPLFAIFWEPLNSILPPLNHILCGVQASLLFLIRRLSYGVEPKQRLQKIYWMALASIVLYLSLIAVLHQDQSLLFSLPLQILLAGLLLLLERQVSRQKHPRYLMVRILLLQQWALLSLSLLILTDLFPLWALPEAGLWIYVGTSSCLLFTGLSSYRAEAVRVSQPSPMPPETTLIPKSENRGNLLHEQWLHAEKMAALGTFTNGLANELNNPLAIIAGHRFRLSSMIDSRSFNIHEFEKSLGKVDQAVNRMISVIDALKVYSQDPQGQAVFKTFSLRETIKYTIDLCRDKVVSRGIKLATPELGDGTMEGHQGQIIQVLLILVDNAIDALELASDKNIRIELQPQTDSIRIAVIDSGSGVALGLRGKIWDPFFTTKDPFRHKGLGLSIASGIITNHRGRILLDESTPETRFVVELPRNRHPLGLVQEAATE